MDCLSCGEPMTFDPDYGWICTNRSCVNFYEDGDAVGDFRDREIQLINEEA